MDIMGRVTVKLDETLYECPATGGVCQYINLETDRGIGWEEAVRLRDEAVAAGRATAGFYAPKLGAVTPPPWVMLALEQPSNAEFFFAVRPITGYSQHFRPM